MNTVLLVVGLTLELVGCVIENRPPVGFTRGRAVGHALAHRASRA